jgi:hypothetical protein
MTGINMRTLSDISHGGVGGAESVGDYDGKNYIVLANAISIQRSRHGARHALASADRHR